MPDSEPKKPTKSDSDSEKRPSSGGKRPKEQKSSNLLWYLMIGAVIALLVFSFVGRGGKRDELAYSQFLVRLESGDLGPANVHKLTIDTGYITFQDQPESESGTTPETTKRYEINAVNLGPDLQAKLVTLLSEKGISDWTLGKPPSDWQFFASILFIPFLFLLLLLFLFRRMGGAGSAMSFGKSRGKLYAQDDVKVTFDDVAGVEEATDELREIVEFLKNPGKYQALGGRIPRGVLLVGPPGTGKTLLAKAVAGEAGVPFFGLSGSDFVEMFVGVGAARVRDMFQQAGQCSPSIIFIDELDALGKVRGSGMPGGHDEREQTLNALLVEMDGFSTEQSVIVMAATNRPETLDPALLRPGRFDRNVLVDRPDMKGREAILKVHAAKIKMADDVNLSHLAKITPGFVGADLANLVNEAALLAVRNDKKHVTNAEFEEGIERVVAGLAKTSRLINEEEKQRVAYHECGHALVSCSLPNTDPVHKISIIPRGFGALGYTLHRPEDERQLVMQTELTSRIACLLGGIAAEEIVYHETSTGAQNDLQRATDLARSMVTEFGMSGKLGRVFYGEQHRGMTPFGPAGFPVEQTHSEDTLREIDLEIKRIIDECYQTAADVLTTRREVLEHMTRELVEVEVMDHKHLKRILDEHTTGPQIKPGTHATATADAPEVEGKEDSLPHRESREGG